MFKALCSFAAIAGLAAAESNILADLAALQSASLSGPLLKDAAQLLAVAESAKVGLGADTCSLDGTDLSGLKAANNVVDTDAGFQYGFEVCGTVTCDVNDCAVCQKFYPDGTNPKCCGTLATQKIIKIGEDKSQSYKFSYTSGTDQRTASVTIKCGEGDSKFTGGTVANTGLSYAISGSQEAACPGSEGGNGKKGGGGGGLSGGWIFIIILFVCSIVYLVGGIVFKKQKMGATGAEMIPNIDMWRGLPGLVADGFRFTKEKITGKTAPGSYESM